MVKKKCKSKRIPASRRYKIQANVREHNRKVRKEAKAGIKKKSLKKDPGVPKLWPLKEELFNEIESSKENIAAAREANRRLNLASIAKEAAAASSKDLPNFFQSSEDGKFNPHYILPANPSDADNSRRSFFREFNSVLTEADVLVMVLDARDPAGSRCEEVEKIIQSKDGADKKLIYVLNKIDLIPTEAAEAWFHYLKSLHPTVLFKSSTQSQKNNLQQQKHRKSRKKSTGTSLSQSLSAIGSGCIGAESLMTLLKNYTRSTSGGSTIKTSITVGIVGYPNVGKSSLINSLKRSRVCTSGAMPGLTKVSQTISLDKHIKLLDCPGIVFKNSVSNEVDPSLLVLRNCVKIDALDDVLSPLAAIWSYIGPNPLMLLYSIPKVNTWQEFLLVLSKSWGFLQKGGVLDIEAAAKRVLTDWTSGKIPFYTLPPPLLSSGNPNIAMENTANIEDKCIISDGWAPAFDLNAMVKSDLSKISQESSSQLNCSSPMLLEKPKFQVDSSSITKASLKNTKKNNNEAVEKEQEILADPLLNPQRNKSMKTAAKKSKKAARKALMEDDYDFETDFIHQDHGAEMQMSD